MDNAVRSKVNGAGFFPVYINNNLWEKINTNVVQREGSTLGDVDNDGDLDFILNGYWLANSGVRADNWQRYDVDSLWFNHPPLSGPNSDSWRDFSVRAQFGDIDGDGKGDILYSHAEHAGFEIAWYKSSNPTGGESAWVKNNIAVCDFCHTLQLKDYDLDGDYDVLSGSTKWKTTGEVRLFLNDGSGIFTEQFVDDKHVYTGVSGDIDNDGDLDFLSARSWENPPIQLWRAEVFDSVVSLDDWQKGFSDDLNWKSTFVDSKDLDGDGLEDIISGGWWWKNPGSLNGVWQKNNVGATFNNFAIVYDFDSDGDYDLLGTQGQGSAVNSNFVWARNRGDGIFDILNNIQSGSGDFLQGVVVERFTAGGPLEVILSWHNTGSGLQKLVVPNNPSVDIWSWSIVSPVTEEEELSLGDIDNDGDKDLLLGSKWLENDLGNSGWIQNILYDAGSSLPDRNELVDINRDGNLDAVIGYESANVPAKLAWYEQGLSANLLWTEHVISNELIGPMSLSAVDFGSDGDIDVVVGEHISNIASGKLIIFENVDGNGNNWVEHIVYTGDEHHDGAMVKDLDQDGDYDIYSIGWHSQKLNLYEDKYII